MKVEDLVISNELNLSRSAIQPIDFLLPDDSYSGTNTIRIAGYSDSYKQETRLDFIIRGQSQLRIRPHRVFVQGELRSREVRTEEVIVKPKDQWSDYVFDNDYDLPSLEEVSSFIEDEGHLPDVPSAEDVKKTGLHLGEMDATLLRKVEELTLYAIEQKRRADSLTSRLERQRKRNDTQQKQIETLQKQLRKLQQRLQDPTPDDQ